MLVWNRGRARQTRRNSAGVRTKPYVADSVVPVGIAYKVGELHERSTAERGGLFLCTTDFGALKLNNIFRY